LYVDNNKRQQQLSNQQTVRIGMFTVAKFAGMRMQLGPCAVFLFQKNIYLVSLVVMFDRVFDTQKSHKGRLDKSRQAVGQLLQ
jgi:hypothetical protein